MSENAEVKGNEFNILLTEAQITHISIQPSHVDVRVALMHNGRILTHISFNNLTYTDEYRKIPYSDECKKAFQHLSDHFKKHIKISLDKFVSALPESTEATGVVESDDFPF